MRPDTIVPVVPSSRHRTRGLPATLGCLLASTVAITIGCAAPDAAAPHAAAPVVPAGALTAQLVAPTPLDLGTLGDPLQQSAATGINDAIQVVGWSETAGGTVHGFLWQQPSGMQDLGTPTGLASKALAINDIGRIVGLAVNSAGGNTPWVWINGQYTLLPVPTGKSGTAQAIAPGTTGFITGCIWTPGQPGTEVVTWNPATSPAFRMTSLGNPGAGQCGTGIDKSRRVAVGNTCCDALVWRAGAFHGLGEPRGVNGMDPAGSGRMTGMAPNSEEVVYWPNLDLGGEYTFHSPHPPTCEVSSYDVGYAVNALGQIVGRGACIFPHARSAFYWASEGEVELLPPLSADSAGCCAEAYALNLLDQVVGYSSTAVSPSHATLWGVVPEVHVIQLPPCSPRPCRVPPKVSYIPKKFINDGILSRPGFDATQLDPNLITLGDGLGHVTRIARTATGAPMASIADVDGDGDLDLSVSFSKAQLIADGVLTPTSYQFEIAFVDVTGLPTKAHYPIWVK